MGTKNVGLVFLRLVFSLLAGIISLNLLTTLVGNDLSLDNVETRETFFVVGDVKTTITCTLHGTEDTVTSGGTDETDVEVSLEWASVVVLLVSD